MAMPIDLPWFQAREFGFDCRSLCKSQLFLARSCDVAIDDERTKRALKWMAIQHFAFVMLASVALCAVLFATPPY